MEKQICRKEISRVVHNNIEVVKYRHFKEEVFTKAELDEILDYWDDSEEAYEVGLAIDFNGDIVWIDVDTFIGSLKDFLEENKDDKDVSFRYPIFLKLHKKLEKWVGYTIWI